MTDTDQLRLEREQADAEFAAACRKLSEAQKEVHAARNRMKTAQRRYIEFLTERRAT
jgi:hypothetical protein